MLIILVEVWSTVSFEHVIMIHGRFLQSNEEFFLCNVYAPCDNGAKQVLWEALSGRLQQLVGKNVCICGDFNVVRALNERRSLRSQSTLTDVVPF
jgi:exonuclease III